MSESGGDPDLAPLIAELTGTLRELESEFEPRTENGLPRPPSPRELMRFTSDVAIPGAILILRTNVEALKLLQRALRMADGRSPTTGTSGGAVRERAEQLSQVSLSRLDGALSDLQAAVEGSPQDDAARELLAEARELRADVQSRLEDRAADRTDAASPEGDDSDASAGGDAQDSAADDGPLPEAQDVPVDVDAELQSLKQEVNGGSGEQGDGAAGEDADGGESDAGPGGDSGAENGAGGSPAGDAGTDPRDGQDDRGGSDDSGDDS